MPAVAELFSAGGDIALGALAVAVDLAAAAVAMRTIAPDWLATADLEIHAQERCPPSAVLVAEPSLLRSGKTTAVFEVLVAAYEDESAIGVAAGLPVAHSTMTFVRIARPELTTDLEHPAEPTEVTRTDFALPDSGFRSPFLQEMGITVDDASKGALTLPDTEFVKNSFGSLQGGIVAALAQAAGETASGDRRQGNAAATDLSVHFLAQGRGPYETRATLLRASDDADLHRVEVRDRTTDTVMATAAVSSSPRARRVS